MYIPKNRIQTNLYTRGDEYQSVVTGLPYTGFYWTMYNGKIFTGKNPNEKPTIELVKIEATTNNIWKAEAREEVFQQYADSWDSEVVPGQYQDLNMLTEYNNVTKTDLSSVRLMPQQYYPSPTDDDYKLGEFTRYFACKLNEPSYLELDKKTYKKMKDQDPEIVWIMYKVFKMQWTLSAITSTIAFNENLNSIELIEKRLNKKGLKDFLNNDFSQFFVKDIGKVLYSKGGDGFVLPNGTAYIGYYHIMADGTPMTGRSHNKGNNIVLTQIYD
jgi:hypothetical protein|tara:strand:- start:67 stop:882 length:816 start_codon:yes stop_codon:yes gene_type:complete